MERLRNSRLSPIPASSSASNAVFPTVLEENSSDNPDLETTVTNTQSERENMHLFRKHRRRLPLVQPCNISKNRSSRSFDSGISCLLQSSEREPGSPAANTAGPIQSDPGNLPGSPNHISSTRQSYMSPCNSPGGPRSPRFRNAPPTSPRPHAPPLANTFFGSNRRFSEQAESYSTKSSEDSDSSPPTEPSPPPNSNSPPPTSPILRVSRRMLPETPKSPYNVWQQSRDSLDSGVYSRSTTCDSYPGRKSGSPILSSTSPPTLARHSWRRGVARLPEPPVNSNSSSGLVWDLALRS